MALYTDPATGPRYDTSNPDHSGWLTKQSAWLRDWRRRHFILKQSKLFFSKHEGSPPHGMIDLARDELSRITLRPAADRLRVGRAGVLRRRRAGDGGRRRRRGRPVRGAIALSTQATDRVARREARHLRSVVPEFD